MLTETLGVGSLHAKVRKLSEVWKRRQWPKVIESFIEPGPADSSPASRARCLGREWAGVPPLGEKRDLETETQGRGGGGGGRRAALRRRGEPALEEAAPGPLPSDSLQAG